MYVNHNKLTKWTKASILDMLTVNDAWVEMALVALYKRQTSPEKAVLATLYEKNEKGFQVADARDFSLYAMKIMRGEHLNADELRNCRRPWKRGRVAIPTIAKYRGQILDMIESKAREKMLAAQ